MSLFNQPAKNATDWNGPLNANFGTAEDKVTFKAICTYAADQNLYTLELQNLPEEYRQNLPGSLPAVFSVEAVMPNSAAYGASFSINGAAFTPKNARFEQWNAVQIIFSNLDRVCFFAAGGGGSGDYEDRLAMLEGMLFSVDGDPFIISFDSLDGIIAEGVWNEAARRMEC